MVSFVWNSSGLRKHAEMFQHCKASFYPAFNIKYFDTRFADFAVRGGCSGFTSEFRRDLYRAQHSEAQIGVCGLLSVLTPTGRIFLKFDIGTYTNACGKAVNFVKFRQT